MIKIYPAIDLIGGQCVRLYKGDFDQQTSYSASPLEMAKKYESLGFKYLHIVDLDAARGSGDNLGVIQEIVSNTKLKIQMGGGVRTMRQAEHMIDAGVDRVILGSVSVKDMSLTKTIGDELGWSRIVLGADVLGDKVMVDGWQRASEVSLLDYIDRYYELGATNFLCTDISKDGTMLGPSVDLYRKIRGLYKDIEILGSGGVGSLSDVKQLISEGVTSVIIGKAIYEKSIALSELAKLQNP